jgi:hypothetical protein
MRIKIATALTCVNLALLVTLLVAAKPAQNDEPTPSQVVRARAFEVLDAQGQVRIQLQATADGDGFVRMRDRNGEVRVKLEAQTDGGVVLFIDKNTEPGARLGADATGNSLRLYGPGQTEKVFSP